MPPMFAPALRQMVTEAKALTIGGGYGQRISGNRSTYGLRDSAGGWDMESVIQDGYERVVWVFKAVEIISGNASRLPFQITAGEDVVERHPLLRVMNKRANPLETGRAFRKRLSAQILLSKQGAFVEVTKDRAGRVTRLDLLAPDRVRIVPDLAGDYVDYFEFTRPDGVVRPLAPERVRWIREPHPLDPFCGVTPLEAAGMSVELDRLARQYNVSFINRDGRPGGIVGVDTDGLPESELDRISRLFAPGAQNAGSVTAIGVGKGGMNYIDTSARPRDMAYETTSDKAKKEILAAFGVPESKAGDSSDRTFDNAEQEDYNFWHDPMLPHLDLIAAAFDGDVDEELDCGYDTSMVEALEIPARRRRQEARDEWDKGLRSLKEYREVAKLDVIDNPQTRALWVSPAKAPVPGQAGDEAALGLDDGTGGAMPGAMGPGGPPPGAPPADGAPETAADVVAAAIAEDADPEAALAAANVNADGPAASLVASARQSDATVNDDGVAAGLVEQARLEGKSLQDAPSPAADNFYDPGDEPARRVELAIAASLESLLNRQAAVVAARLEAPKHRRGTAYWVPGSDTDERAGDEPIDTARVVNASRWIAETQETLQPMLRSAAKDSAADIYTTMAAAGALVVPLAAGAVVAGRVREAAVASAEQIAQYAAYAAMAPTMLALAVAQTAMEDWQNERIADVEGLLSNQGTPDLPSLVQDIKDLWTEKARPFAESMAVTLSQTSVSGGRESAAAALVAQSGDEDAPGSADEVTRSWRTRRDEDVRRAHKEAEGQTVRIGEPFEVGGFDVRYPSDPLAPPSVSRWCRCWLRYEWLPGSRFVVPTRGEAAAA